MSVLVTPGLVYVQWIFINCPNPTDQVIPRQAQPPPTGRWKGEGEPQAVEPFTITLLQDTAAAAAAGVRMRH